MSTEHAVLTNAALAAQNERVFAAFAAPVAKKVVARKVIWLLALILMVIFAVDGFVTFEIQKSAPQQAAAAAAACFHMITPYVIARALDELLRGRNELG